MRIRKPLIFLAIAIGISLVIGRFSTTKPFQEQLILIQAEQELGHIDKAILNEPLAIQALLLDYSGDKELTLKAWIALSKYPEKTREIFLLYGSEPEFKVILRNYGESIIPVIQYFRENDVWSVSAKIVIENYIKRINENIVQFWDFMTGNAHPNPVPPFQPPKPGQDVGVWSAGKNSIDKLLNFMAGNAPINLNPAPSAQPRKDEHGWYAVNVIKVEGHHFLGQFVVDKTTNKAKWNQTDRFFQNLTAFFTSGIRNLETKKDLGEDITTSDLFWAGLDVAIVAVPVKLLGAGGKAIGRTGKELSLPARTKVFAPRLLSEVKFLQSMGKFSVVAATTYIIIKHPSLINSVFAEIAKFLGFNPWLVQLAGWAFIIFLVLYPFSWLLKPLARFVLCSLSWIEWSCKKIIPKTTTTAPMSVSTSSHGV